MMPCLVFRNILKQLMFETGSSGGRGVEGRVSLLVASRFLAYSLQLHLDIIFLDYLHL